MAIFHFLHEQRARVLLSYRITLSLSCYLRNKTIRQGRKSFFPLVFTKIACEINDMTYCFCKRAATHCHNRRNPVGGHLRYLNNTF